MKDKINIAELLKDCPKGMELDCTMFDNVKFDCIDYSHSRLFPIRLKRIDGCRMHVTEYGQHDNVDSAKCVIFPKGKTTWEGFVPPCKFKDGDVLSYQCAGLRNRTIYIYRHHHTMNTSYYVALGGDLEFMVNPKEGHALSGNNTTARLATEEEKVKLFQAIKDNGYKWNPDNKTLEKLPKFNNKFDLNILVPFESKVLVRDYDIQIWIPTFWGKYLKDGSNCSYLTTNGCYKCCVPYEGNEHLLGTTSACDKFYRTWE